MKATSLFLSCAALAYASYRHRPPGTVDFADHNCLYSPEWSSLRTGFELECEHSRRISTLKCSSTVTNWREHGLPFLAIDDTFPEGSNYFWKFNCVAAMHRTCHECNLSHVLTMGQFMSQRFRLTCDRFTKSASLSNFAFKSCSDQVAHWESWPYWSWTCSSAWTSGLKWDTTLWASELQKGIHHFIPF